VPAGRSDQGSCQRVREALTNAGRHADVRNVSLFVEVADSTALALVRDRGCGFDPAAGSPPDRRGIPTRSSQRSACD